MVDKYGTGQDPDCYSGTSTLINFLNILDDHTLETAERDITHLCAEEIEFRAPPYNFQYLCDIHRMLFQDIYPWAGQVRQIDISKGSTHFCNTDFIEAEANKLFSSFESRFYFQNLDRDELVSAIAELYGDLNMIHPFRDGNGRAQRILFEHIIANADFEIYWEPAGQQEWITANIAAVTCDYEPLKTIFERCIGKRLGEP